MKTMKQRMFDGIKDGVSRSIGNMAIKSGDVALERCCVTFLHEPKIPQELLKKYQ
ncbi:cyclic lactone autoinducer peptide [Paenibacillus sp. 19GGS1-52]|uniref:cyclic lactone autoinducer peptide n=1 Tax=Paenibacillus sp. 19GGS1-52 TaxID=2758563 RepID=UPI001EFB5FEE|nr:cyclic lactone autoinducer peptide [Paenibacillus sp. 19GGS1-52]ULO08722.1 cyclic lactone autoinducer peptide [Paenibacillus sp. 19GGS1-52]